MDVVGLLTFEEIGFESGFWPGLGMVIVCMIGEGGEAGKGGVLGICWLVVGGLATEVEGAVEDGGDDGVGADGEVGMGEGVGVDLGGVGCGFGTDGFGDDESMADFASLFRSDVLYTRV